MTRIIKTINYPLALRLLIFLWIISQIISLPQSQWYEIESNHFKLIYKDAHSHLAQHILTSAESALTPIMKIFDYSPSEKIIINTYDIFDYGYASATSVPQNFIRLEIEPFEPGYENVPYNERFQWVLNHELIHIAVNDQSNKFESLSRKLFSKVIPEQAQPLTIFFSLLTNNNRYTPRWHQEAIAVFFETWLSGGFGRILGNFDEMYFRTMFIENQDFPSEVKLETIKSHSSFLLETLFYLYGGRFASYLTIHYGPEKFINWFKSNEDSFYNGFKNKFESVFEVDFNDAWDDFISFEKEFQKENIKRLNKTELTPIKKISEASFGWVSQPHLDITSNILYFGYHKSHQLAAIQKLNISNGRFEDIISLPTPSIYQVASTAYDRRNNLFFYTTNNNQLFRDVWLLDPLTKKNIQLFANYRIGHLTVSPVTHELWGIQHNGAHSTLFLSSYPYKKIEPVFQFDVGDEIQQISISPSGQYLAAVLHKTDGSQLLLIANTENLKPGTSFRYKIISESGSPENVSWSSDEKFVYWNAYTNGVSNIYRADIADNNIEAMSHTLKGLFKPVVLNSHSIFAFEFSSEGFVPVLIPNKPAIHLPAIQYMGQILLDENPQLMNLTINKSEAGLRANFGKDDYNSLANLKINTFIPVISGFQSQKVLGFYTHISDPLLLQDFTMEFGYSPFNENPAVPEYHLKLKYDFKKQYEFAFDYNAPDFYDLFNERKRGMIGMKIRLGHTYYWLYDNPHKIKQQTDVSFYRGVEFINDNLVAVSEPDFIVAQTILNSKNLRRSIGSSDSEYGNDFTITLMGFGSNPDNPEIAGQLFAEWSNFSTWILPHNVFHFTLAAGYHNKNDNLYQARFYFGGFGNREVENIDVKQYRKVFRFPGIPIYSLSAEQFGKVMIENNFPPIRFSNLSLWSHILNHIDFSIYSQGLLVKTAEDNKWLDIGGQINFIFKHWYNLESTFSAGIAKAWSENQNSWEWFLSLKLLKN